MGIHASICSLHYHRAGASINPPFCWKHHAVFQYQIAYVLCWWHSSPEGKVLHHCPWVKQWNFSYIASIFSHRDSVNLKKWMCLYIGSVARVYALYLWFHLWSRLEGRWKWGARSLMANNSLMVSTPDTETPFFFSSLWETFGWTQGAWGALGKVCCCLKCFLCCRPTYIAF